MKISRLRAAASVAVLLCTTNLGLAHPGHDGDHGLTWDFRHLGEQPVATALCGVVLAATVWGLAQLAIALVARLQSLRRSAASRGK